MFLFFSFFKAVLMFYGDFIAFGSWKIYLPSCYEIEVVEFNAAKK